MRNLYLILTFLVYSANFSQVKGTVTDEKGSPLSLVTVFEENTFNGTSTNELGQYDLNIKTLGRHILVFKYLGSKTKKISILIEKFPFIQNIKLEEETLSLPEIVINKKTAEDKTKIVTKLKSDLKKTDQLV